MSPSQNQVKCGPAQVVRILFRDCDATDSESDSSSDESIQPVGKTIVKTVVISKPRSALMEPDDRQKKKKYRGVRKRLSGRWCSEIRDRTVKKRLWLGTFDTPEEAAAAYNGAWRRIRGTDFAVEDNRVKESVENVDNVQCKS